MAISCFSDIRTNCFFPVTGFRAQALKKRNAIEKLIKRMFLLIEAYCVVKRVVVLIDLWVIFFVHVVYFLVLILISAGYLGLPASCHLQFPGSIPHTSLLRIYGPGVLLKTCKRERQACLQVHKPHHKYPSGRN